MTGRYAAVLDCCGEWDSTMLDEAIGSDDVVIIVKHPFQNRWIDHLLPELAATEKCGFLSIPMQMTSLLSLPECINIFFLWYWIFL